MKLVDPLLPAARAHWMPSYRKPRCDGVCTHKSEKSRPTDSGMPWATPRSRAATCAAVPSIQPGARHAGIVLAFKAGHETPIDRVPWRGARGCGGWGPEAEVRRDRHG